MFVEELNQMQKWRSLDLYLTFLCTCQKSSELSQRVWDAVEGQSKLQEVLGNITKSSM